MTKKEFIKKQKQEIIEPNAEFKAVKCFPGKNNAGSVLGIFQSELDKIFYIYNKVDKEVYKYLPNDKYKNYPSEQWSNWNEPKFQIPLNEFELIDFSNIEKKEEEVFDFTVFSKTKEVEKPTDFFETKPVKPVVEAEKKKNYFVDSRIQRINNCQAKLDEITKELKLLIKEIQ